ncbi:MAG: hypothetical protein RL247_694, partial [Actinomycetota bacterium]
MSTFVIRNATGLDGTVGTLAIRDGVFVPPDSLSGIKGVVTVDASGLQALPGLVDLHTHLRQPGAEGAETIASGSRAAALGGYTAVHAMANTDPVADNAERVCDVWNWGRQVGYVDVRPVGAVTEGLLGLHLSDMASMAHSFAAVRVFSDDGKCVHHDDMMRSALHNAHAVGGVVAQHAQAPHLTQGAVMNAGRLAATLGLVGWPAVAEESIIERDIALASEVGARLHVCHVSTSGSVGLIREAKARGVAVTAEVTP